MEYSVACQLCRFIMYRRESESETEMFTLKIKAGYYVNLLLWFNVADNCTLCAGDISNVIYHIPTYGCKQGMVRGDGDCRFIDLVETHREQRTKTK